MAEVLLTQEMARAFDAALMAGRPAIVATADSAGTPDVAYKGSLIVLDRDRLAYWERVHGTTLKNLQENPKISVLYWNPVVRHMWKFSGVAELDSTGARRMEVMAKVNKLEIERDPERKGIAVVIRVDRVYQLGRVIMERGSGD